MFIFMFPSHDLCSVEPERVGEEAEEVRPVCRHSEGKIQARVSGFAGVDSGVAEGAGQDGALAGSGGEVERGVS